MKAYVVLSIAKYDALMAQLPPEQTDPETGEVTFSPTLKDIPQIGADLERIFGSMIDFATQRQSKDGQFAIFEIDIAEADVAIVQQWQTDGIISSWHWWQHDAVACGQKNPGPGYPCIHCYINQNAVEYL